jgi:hypothetical protein
MGEYASNTNVSADRSREQIERTLMRYGADEFGYKTTRQHALVEFLLNGLRVQIAIPLPQMDDRRFTHTEGRGTIRSTDAALKLWAIACRQKWRILLLMIKAKLEAVDEGITTIEKEFLADIQLPGQGSVLAYLIKQAESGAIQGLLPAPKGESDANQK